MPGKKPKKPAATVAKRKSPRQKARAATPVKGPLTLEQARAIVDRSAEAKPRTSRAPEPLRARSGARGVVASVEATPATLAIERRRLAIEQRDEHKRRAREYKAVLKLLQTHGVKGLPEPAPAQGLGGSRRAPGGPRTAPAAAVATGPLRVFAEGDSWFDYPAPFFGGGVVDRLQKRLGVPILNMAKAGDETRFMLGVEQRQLIARRLREGCPDGSPWELMLFSGGGNDIAAQPLALWLRDYKVVAPAKDLLNQTRFAHVLALVRAAYEDLIALRDLHSPQTRLLFHGYDFAIPDGRSICGYGPWLKPAFDVHGFPADMVVSTAVVREMLTQFAAMLTALAMLPRVHLVDTQGTLAPTPASWHNELHPSKSGFNLMADKFQAAIKLLFPGRVLI